MGRPAHKPDPTSRRQVEAMAAYGVSEKDVATVIGVDPKTLRKHYRAELDTGEIKANSKVAESLYRKALGDGSPIGHGRHLLAEDAGAVAGSPSDPRGDPQRLQPDDRRGA